MALKIGSISRKPGLIWRGAISERPGSWAPLLRGLMARYQVGIESDPAVSQGPPDLASLQGRQPADVVVTLDVTAPGLGRVPESGHWVHLPLWDFTTMPEAWQVPLLNGTDALWVGSALQMAGFNADGYPAARMAVVTPGVDTTVFHPDVTPAPPAGAKGHRLLFIGDFAWNGALNILLKAYAAEFVHSEDITLIVADLATANPDIRKDALAQLAALQETADTPHILHVEAPTDPAERSALIACADALVHVARDASHPWPVLEALACGVPVIVQESGPGSALAPIEASWRVRGRMMHVNETQVGTIATRGHHSFIDTDLGDLRRNLRLAFEHDEERESKRQPARAAAEARAWPVVVEAVTALLETLCQQKLVREQVHEITVAFSQANTAFMAQQFDQVVALLGPYVSVAPPAPDFFALYGSALVCTGAPAQAIAPIERALRLNPNNPNYYNIIGVALFQLREYAIAKRFFDATMRLQPEHPGAKTSLADMKRQLMGKSQKMRDRMGDDYKRLLTLLDNPLLAPTKAQRLSVSMIVKNEEAMLAKALASIQAIADEIVVVDTGSTDRTVEIAESFGAKVFHFDWTGDFSAARNAALDHCTGDWVLALDADEEVQPEGARVLQLMIARPYAKPVIYLPRIVNLVNDNDADAIEHYGPRLFPRVPELRWIGRIHEQILHTTLGDKGLDRMRVPDLVLHHWGYNREMMSDRGKEARNFGLLETSLKEEPDNPFHHFNMGVSLRVADRVAEAIPYFRKTIDLCGKLGITPMYLASSYNYLVASLVASDRVKEALELALSCEVFCQDQPDYWLNRGIANDKLADYPAAIAAFTRCLDLRNSSAPILADRGAMTWKPYAGIGSAHMKLGDFEKGERYMRMAIKENPKNMELRRVLINQGIQRGDFDRVEADLKGMLTEIQQPERRVVFQDLANLYISRHRFDDGVVLLQGALAEADDTARPGAVSDLARYFQAIGRKEDALALMEQHRLSDGVFEELSRLYCELKDWQALADLGDALLGKGLGEAFAHAYRGVAKFQLGDLTNAEADFRAAVALNEKDFESWNNLGVVALAHEKLDEAEGYYLKALDLQPTYFTANFDLGKIAQHRGDLETAYGYLKKAVEAYGENVEAIVRIADLADTLGQREEAERHWVEAIHLEPADSNHWVSLGYHYLRHEEPQSALRVLSEALAISKENPAVYSGLGITLLELGNAEDARNAFIMAVQLRPDDLEALRGFQIADQLCVGNAT
jgi:tetratricopeptide (TPR) repeat protein